MGTAFASALVSLGGDWKHWQQLQSRARASERMERLFDGGKLGTVILDRSPVQHNPVRTFRPVQFVPTGQ